MCRRFLPQSLPEFKFSRRLKMLKSSLTTGRVSNRLEFRRFGDLLCVHRHRITLHYSAMMQTEQNSIHTTRLVEREHFITGMRNLPAVFVTVKA